MPLRFKPRWQTYYLLRHNVWLLISAFVSFSVVPLLAEGDRETQQVRLDRELELRRHLMKLDRWRVSQLLRTERELDNEQKRRANTSTNPLELELLADDEDVGVRFLVATNRYASHSTVMQLAADRDPSVRSGVAMALSYDVLASRQVQDLTETIGIQLANDSHVLVRINIASNEKLSEFIYLAIAQDIDYAVRKKLAENKRLPGIVLEQLAKDSVSVVQTAALIHRNIPSHVLMEMATHPNTNTRLAVGGNNNVPVSTLDQMSQDSVPSIRRLVALHPRTELSTLNKLIHDSDQEILLAIAKHPNADRRLLMTLAYHESNGNVRMEAQNRLEPLLRREIREDILERWKTDNTLR